MPNQYTLVELVDRALRYPQVGAVNFNILRVVLLKILSEVGLENVLAEWEPAPSKLNFREILLMNVDTVQFNKQSQTDVAEEHKYGEESEEKSGVEEDIEDETEEKSDAEMEEEFEEKEDSTECINEPEKPENVEPDKRDDMIESLDDEKIQEDSKVVQEVNKESEDEETEPSEIKIEMVKIKEIVDTHNTAILYNSEQINQAITSIQAAEERINTLIKTVEDLKEFTEKRLERRDFLKGEKRVRKTGDITRDEFENTVDDLGEAIAIIGQRQRQQKEDWVTDKSTIMNNLSQKPSFEEIEKSKERTRRKLEILASAVKKIQKVIKEVLNPDSCAVTNCMACGRKSELPLKYIFTNHSKISEMPEDRNASPPRLDKNVPSEPEPQLKFTPACMTKFQGEKLIPIYREDADLDSVILDDSIQKSTVLDRAVDVKPLFNVSSLVDDFAPLREFPGVMRRKTINIPADSSKYVPISPTVVEKENGTFIVERYGRQ